MWTYNGAAFTDDMIGDNIGFVYIIINHTNGKRYIGKKLFTKSKTFQKNKKRKKMRVASDWENYTGSNESLNNDIQSGHVITKEILYLAKTKGWCTYLETKEILARDCLLSDSWYNEWCSMKVHSKHLKCPK